MTRRDFFSGLLPSRWAARPAAPAVTRAKAAPANEGPQVAVIAGRHCLAYQGSFCSTCRERCPIDGAIVIERGLPRVNPALCNGCRLCHDLCPAPVNAVLLVGRDASPRRPQAMSATGTTTPETSARPPYLHA